MPGIGDKLSAMFGGGANVQAVNPNTTAQQGQTSNLAASGYPGAIAASGTPSGVGGGPPSLAGPSQNLVARALQIQAADPSGQMSFSDALMVAQMQQANQGPSGTAIATAGLADVGNELLEAKLKPELGELPHPVPIGVNAPGPLAFQVGPGPNPALTTASIIAELV